MDGDKRTVVTISQYMKVKSLYYKPYTYTELYVNNISIKLKNKENKIGAQAQTAFGKTKVEHYIRKNTRLSE